MTTCRGARGGSWYNALTGPRSANRHRLGPDIRGDILGFRVTARPSARRALRGGSWLVNPRYLRSAKPNWDEPDNRYISIGFRVVVRP